MPTNDTEKRIAGKQLAIIIDTEQYAGNFEREMVAYVTGLVGECDVGERQAVEARESLSPDVLGWFDACVVYVPDEHGCKRPANIAPTPGWSNNGLGAHRKLKSNESPKYLAYLSVEMVVREWPPDDVAAVIVERVREFCQRREIPVTRIRCVERTTTEESRVTHEF